MNAAARLGSFGVVLVLLFAGAAVTGSAVGPDRDGGAAAGGSPGGHGDGDAAHGEGDATHDDAAVAGPVRGLAISDRGLTLDLEQAEVPRGRPTELQFAILDEAGRRVRDFEVEHERRMHLIVVRRDGHGFQHLHPEIGGDGVWRVRVTLRDPGAYRVFADFARGGTARTLAADLTVDGDADYRPSPPTTTTAVVDDGYAVRLDTEALRAGEDVELRFTVARDGRTVHTEPYLGAGGHLVALREGDLAYLHVHPDDHSEETGDAREAEDHDDAVAFRSRFPSEGRYRLFLQFRHEGQVRTASFTQEVGR